MAELALKVVADLREGRSLVASDTLRIAGDLLAKVASQGQYHSGVADVDSCDVSDEEVNEIKAAILERLRGEDDLRIAGNLVWALGKSGDPALTEVYTFQLQRFVEATLAGNSGIWQVEFALENAGDPAAMPVAAGSRGTLYVERGLEWARAYLMQRGIVVPW